MSSSPSLHRARVTSAPPDQATAPSCRSTTLRCGTSSSSSQVPNAMPLIPPFATATAPGFRAIAPSLGQGFRTSSMSVHHRTTSAFDVGILEPLASSDRRRATSGRPSPPPRPGTPPMFPPFVSSRPEPRRQFPWPMGWQSQVSGFMAPPIPVQPPVCMPPPPLQLPTMPPWTLVQDLSMQASPWERPLPPWMMNPPGGM